MRLLTMAILVGLLQGVTFSAEGVAEVAVGMSGRVTVTISGTELEAKPYDDRKIPLLLRIRSVKPAGQELRYELEYQGLDPGSYDLKNYLRRKDGSTMEGVPAIVVKIVPELPPGQHEPNPLQNDASFWMGGYRWWLWVGGALWLTGLLAILYFGFWPKRRSETGKASAPVTLADRLRPLVERAMTGQAQVAELASLERCLLAWWRRKLSVDDQPIGQSDGQLRSHAEAGPLLQQLELWLHRPGTRDQVDVALLLLPYRHVAADALEGAL